MTADLTADLTGGLSADRASHTPEFFIDRARQPTVVRSRLPGPDFGSERLCCAADNEKDVQSGPPQARRNDGINWKN